MANYHEEFREYANIIQKKTLRDIISFHYSSNEVKLGALLSCCQNSNTKIKNWLLAVHRACKVSKHDMSQNQYLSTFKLKLSRVSEKMIAEIKSGGFNRVKIKKCAFIKKNSKALPHDIQQLVSEISCFISETLDEDNINIISPCLINENSILKRKRFSRQLKESLIKYCKDFNNFGDPHDHVCDLSNTNEEYSEIQSYFCKFDATLPNLEQHKKMLDMELLLANEVPLETNFPKYSSTLSLEAINLNQIEKCDDVDMEFNDFNIIEEWNEDCQTVPIETRTEDNFAITIFRSFSKFIEETSNKIIIDMKEPIERSNTIEISHDFHQLVTENHSVSNLQQSYLSDIKKRLLLAIKMKKPKKESRSESDGEESLVRHKVLCSKPRPFIKILSLKKPNVYVDNSVIETSKEQFLESIPLPDYIIDDVTESVSTILPEIVEKVEIVHVTEECDNRVDESILESILDFSEVLVDDFECSDSKETFREEVEDHIAVAANDSVVIPDYDLQDNFIPERTVVLMPEEHCIDDTKKEEEIIIITSVNERKISPESIVSVNFPKDISSNSDLGTVTRSQRTNYSVYSPEKRISDIAKEFYNFNNNEENDIEMYEYQARDYYDPPHNEYRLNSGNSSIMGNNTNRYMERGSQRLFHNFLRYTTESNETRPFFNQSSYRYRGAGSYRPNY